MSVDCAPPKISDNCFTSCSPFALCPQTLVLLQAYSLRQGRPVSDADYAPGRTRYENTGQLQLLRKSYQYGTPTNSPTLGNFRSNQTSTKEVDVQELTQQLKIPLYKQLIGNTAMVDLSSLSANPQVRSCAYACTSIVVPESCYTSAISPISIAVLGTMHAVVISSLVTSWGTLLFLLRMQVSCFWCISPCLWFGSSQVKILGKCEFANPSGSIKDRIADHILTTAEQEGKLKPGGTVVAATSGNTGASVAMIAAMKGYHYIGTVRHSSCSQVCCVQPSL